MSSKRNELIKMYKSTIYNSLILKDYSDIESKEKLSLIIKALMN